MKLFRQLQTAGIETGIIHIYKASEEKYLNTALKIPKKTGILS